MTNRIEQLRKEKNLSMVGMSNELVKSKLFDSISDATISNYENGKRDPKIETWQKLADFFDVDVAYLQGLSDYRNSQEAYESFLDKSEDDIKNSVTIDDLKETLAMDANYLDGLIKVIDSYDESQGHGTLHHVNIQQKRALAYHIYEALAKADGLAKYSSKRSNTYINSLLTTDNKYIN